MTKCSRDVLEMTMGIALLGAGVRNRSDSLMCAAASSDNRDMHEMPFFLVSTSIDVAILAITGEMEATCQSVRSDNG